MFLKVAALLLAVFFVVASSGLVGAPEDADINSLEVQDALHFAIAQHNTASGYISKVVKVINVQEQVISGWKFFFTIEIAKISCKIGEPETTCSDPQTEQAHECKLAVWSQPWLNRMTLIEDTC